MSRVLVLNATYEPLSVVPARRGVVLVLHGRAVALATGDTAWAAERLTVPVPSVVKLVSYVRVPFDRKVPVTRRAVFSRDANTCQYCAGPAESIDHVIPRSRGGQHTWENVVACCRRCNVGKGNRLPSESGMILARRPTVPSRHSWVYASAGHRLDPAWEAFLEAAESA